MKVKLQVEVMHYEYFEVDIDDAEFEEWSGGAEPTDDSVIEFIESRREPWQAIIGKAVAKSDDWEGSDILTAQIIPEGQATT